MKDQYRTKKQLIEELEGLRNQFVKLKKAETKRKRVEEALQTTNERLNYLLTSTSAAIYTSKTSGDYGATSITENVKQMMGYEPREFIENSSFWIGHVHPEDRQRLLKELPRIFEQESYIYEYRFLHKDGNYRWVCDDMKLIKDEFGSPIEIIGYWTDITERKQAEEKLKESERRFRIIFEGAIDGILLADIETKKFHTGNIMICTMLGYSLEEIKNLSVTDIHPKEALPFVMEQFDKLARGEITKTSELPVKRKDGSVFYAEISTVLLKLDGGTYLMGTFRDITERKQAEEELKESQKRFAIAAQSTSDLIWDWNIPTGRLQWFGAIDELLGYAPGKFPRTIEAWEKVIHPDDHDRVMATLDQHLKGQRPYDEEYRVRRKDGTYRYWIDRGTVLRDGQGNPLKMVGACTDITERKQAEEALRESEERYRRLVDNSLMGIGISCGGQVIFANPALLRLFGYDDLEEFTKIPLLNHVAPASHELIVARMEKVAQGESVPVEFEYDILRKNGLTRTLLASSQHFTLGGATYAQTIFQDITERKRAEEAVRESEERFRLAFENANTGVCLVDLEGNLTKVNNKMCEIFGYTREELEHMTVNDIAHPEDMDKSPTFIQRTLRGETDRGTFEKRYLHKKSHVVTCQVSSSLVRDAEGSPLYFISHVHDITDRKRAEEALRQSEERYRTILEDIEDGYFEVDLAGHSTFMNDSLCKIHGYPREELLGIDYRQFVDKENAKKMFEAFNQIYRTGEPRKVFDYELIRKDGTKRQVEVYASLKRDSSGNPIGFRGITRDVTERKKAEEALQKEREISLSILENAPYGVALIDKDGKYIYINPEFTNITGYTLEDVPTGKDWFRKAFPDPKDRERVIQVWKEDRSKGNMMNREFSMNCKDGKIKEIEIRSTFLRDGRAVIVLHDITEQKRAEEEMKSLQEQLRQSQKMEAIGRLAGGIAHDFNNLLTIIKGYSQLSLIELKEDSPLKGNIEQIHRATDRAADLVRQLLAFSRRQILEMKVLDLNTTLANLHNMLRRLIGEDIELITVLAEDLGRVKTDLGWIEQAIMNLVVNARDAMASGGKLTIETGNADLDKAYLGGHVGVKPGRYVMLSVSDTGVGMTPEVRERLFEPFFSTKEKDKGTGLGLSTVYGIVKQSGGDIWVYSEPGKGATLKIYLPRVDEPLEQPREKVLGDELLRGSETILLVEDEEDVRKLTLRVLERQGYKVLAARDGDEALLVCEQHKDPIHLMLTDVVMPGMSGHEVAKRLEPFHPETKVLYMSGYTDNAIVLHGVLVQGVNYIQKPFTVDALTKKVREVLEQ